MIVDFNRFHKRSIEIANREKLLESKTQCTIAFVTDSKGVVLKEGWNSLTKTHPIQKRAAQCFGDLKEKEFMHAEIHAITRSMNSNRRHGIVVIRLDKEYNMLFAKPCPICGMVIRHYGIKEIAHS